MSENSSLEEKIVSLLQEKGWKIASAESCSGGMIASRLVNVSGVSDVFEEGYLSEDLAMLCEPGELVEMPENGKLLGLIRKRLEELLAG